MATDEWNNRIAYTNLPSKIMRFPTSETGLSRSPQTNGWDWLMVYVQAFARRWRRTTRRRWCLAPLDRTLRVLYSGCWVFHGARPSLLVLEMTPLGVSWPGTAAYANTKRGQQRWWTNHEPCRRLLSVPIKKNLFNLAWRGRSNGVTTTEIHFWEL